MITKDKDFSPSFPDARHSSWESLRPSEDAKTQILDQLETPNSDAASLEEKLEFNQDYFSAERPKSHFIVQGFPQTYAHTLPPPHE